MYINRGISGRIKQIRSGMIALLFLAAYGVSALTPFVSAPRAYAFSEESGSQEQRSPQGPENSKKVFVCKYVGTPGINETLQTGNNPLSVSVNAIQGYQGVGSYFSDAQGKSYVLASDNGQPKPPVSQCPAPQGPTKIEVPATPTVTDPCGLGNATWVQPSNTTQVSWSLVGGHLIATAKAGYIFTGNAATYDYGVAPDSGRLCTILVQAAPPVITQDSCGTKNDTYTIPAVEGVQYYVNDQPVEPGTYSTHGDTHIEINARAKQGYVLTTEDVCWTLHFTNNKQCVVDIKPIAPQWPVVNCGPTNDSITLPEQEGVTYSAVWQGNTLVVTATANEGYKFPHNTKTVWKFVDKETPCPVEIAVPEDPVVVCGVDNDVLTVPEDSAYVTYSQTGWVNGENTVTATAADGYYIAGTEGKQTSVEWTFYDDATLCETEVIVPTDPIVVCGVNNDVVTVPKSDHVTYTQTGWVEGKNTITATADTGYYIAGTEGATTQTWTYIDTGTSCGHVLGDTTTTPNATPTSAPRLEDTGNSIILPMLMSTGVLGLAVMTVLQNDRRSGRVAKRLQALFDKIGVQLSQPFVVPTA